MKVIKWLIPGKNNRYHPHLLRPLGLLCVVLALLAINITYNFTSAKKFQILGYATNMSSSEIISLSNAQRTNQGMSPLSYNAQLTSAAQAKAQDMFANGYWAHTSPSGKTPWYFITNAGYSYSTAGENLAKDFSTSSGVVNAWMNSSSHRANIINSSYVHTGVAVVNGVFNGKETTIVVAMYASPKAAPAPAPAPAPTPSAPTPSTSQSSPTKQPPAPSRVATPITEPTPAPAENLKEPEPIQKEVASEQPASTATIREQTATTTVAPEPDTIELVLTALSPTSRTWAQNSTLFILATLFLITVLKHTLIWRTQKRGWRHIWLRSHPVAQYLLLGTAIVFTITTGSGVIL